MTDDKKTPTDESVDATETPSDEEETPSESTEKDVSKGTLKAIYNVPVEVSAVLGSAQLPVNQLLKMGRGAVIQLDRKVGEAVDIYVNNRLIARGEVVVVNEQIGITMTEIIKIYN